MGDPVTTAAIVIAIGSTLVGGTTAYMSAEQAEKQAEAYEKAQKKAFLENARQQQARMQAEQYRSTNRANLIRSRIRVAAGEAGLGFGGTYDALMRQADYDDYINRDIIAQNAMLNIRAAQSAMQPTPGTMNPVVAAMLSGLQSGLSGFQSGLAIGGGVQEAKTPTQAQLPGFPK